MTFTMLLTGFVGGPEFNARKVRAVLNANKDKHVDILIDSFGGSLAEGLSICSALRDHGDVTVHFRGMNASAATLASMGAKSISIAPEAMYLIHQVSMGFFDWASRNADQLESFIEELRKAKDDLDTMDNSIAQLYAARCKKPPKDMLQLMRAEKWISAQQALEWGFVDSVTSYSSQDDTDSKPKDKISKAEAAQFRALGIPLPPVEIESEQSSMLASIKNAITDSIKSFLNKSSHMNTETTGTPHNIENVGNNGNIESPDNNNNNNIGNVENNENNELERLKAENEALKAQNNALKAKTPAASTSSVVESPKAATEKKESTHDAFETYCATHKSASKLFNSIP